MKTGAFTIPTTYNGAPWFVADTPRFVLVEHRAGLSLLVSQYPHSDYYVGSAAQLVAAGLMENGKFPGDPGCNKTMQSVSSDGRLLNTNCRAAAGAGVRYIALKKKGVFLLRIKTSEEEDERRRRLDSCFAFVTAVMNEMLSLPDLTRGLEEARRDRALQAFIAKLRATEDA